MSGGSRYGMFEHTFSESPDIPQAFQNGVVHFLLFAVQGVEPGSRASYSTKALFPSQTLQFSVELS